MVEHFNELSPAEAERLAYLIEEMGEALHCAGKVLRHGYESVNPDGKSDYTNRSMLGDELCDVLTAIQRMVDECDLAPTELSGSSRWFHHQPAPTTEQE